MDKFKFVQEIIDNWKNAQGGLFQTDNPIQCPICKTWIKSFPLTKKKDFCLWCFIQQIGIVIFKESRKTFIEDCKRRLSSCKEKDGLFPFAGQEYRNNIIKMFEKLEEEVLLEGVKNG